LIAASSLLCSSYFLNLWSKEKRKNEDEKGKGGGEKKKQKWAGNTGSAAAPITFPLLAKKGNRAGSKGPAPAGGVNRGLDDSKGLSIAVAAMALRAHPLLRKRKKERRRVRGAIASTKSASRFFEGGKMKEEKVEKNEIRVPVSRAAVRGVRLRRCWGASLFYLSHISPNMRGKRRRGKEGRR